MKISQIILRDFGKFENFTANFVPGLNVIKGPNEGGKSTIAWAVAAALFADPAANEEFISSAARWGENRAPVLEATLDVDGDNFKLTKDFEKHVAALAPENVNLPGGETADIGSWLSDKLGMPSGEVFRSTAFINQGEINHIDDSIEAIKDKLESLATRGDEDHAASSNIKKIQQRIESLTSETGEENRLNKFKADLEYDIEKLQRDMAGLKIKRADLIQVETAFVNVRDDLAERKLNIERAEIAREAAKTTAELTAEIERLEKQITSAGEAKQKIDEIKSQKSGLKRVSKEELSQIEQHESSLNHLRPKYGELKEETGEAENDLKLYRIGGINTVMALLGFVGLGFSATCHFLNILPGALPYLWYSLAGSAGLLIMGLSITITRRQHRSYLSGNFNKLSSKLEALGTEIEERENNLSDKLSNYLVSSIEELKKNQWRYEELDGQLEKQTAHYNEIVSGKTLADIEDKFEQLNKENVLILGENDESKSYLLDPADIEREILVVNEIEERIKDLERERAVLSQYMEMAEGGSELLTGYQERLEMFEKQSDNLKHELKILDLSSQCIEEARQNALTSKLEVLNARTSEIADSLTDGRYSKVRFDKSNLKFEVWSDEKDGWVNPEKCLSSGTVDQIYLAVRLALTDLISEEKNSILILDDPFTNYDGRRLENVMKVLKKLSKNHQILLLTGQDHYDRWADATINL
ncbi:MAG: AAA family ATPase [candidate division Zixibacteria bacterium]